MRNIILFLAGLFIIELAGCKHIIDGTDLNKGTKEEYNVYSGYYYKGVKPSTDTTMIFPMFTKGEFDSYFHPLPPPIEQDTIPFSELSTKPVFAIVKYGNKYFDLKISSIESLDNILIVKYTSVLKADSMSWTAAIPIIFTTKKSFTNLKFYENGKYVEMMGFGD